MKRTHSAEDASDPKRQKLEHPLFQHRRKATDIYEQGCDGTGYLEGTVRMRWPLTKESLRIRVESKENAKNISFEINFTKDAVTALSSSGLKFEIGDQIQLALQGAEMNLLRSSTIHLKSSESLPFMLVYREKLALRLVSRAKQSAPLLSVDNLTSMFELCPCLHTIISQ